MVLGVVVDDVEVFPTVPCCSTSKTSRRITSSSISQILRQSVLAGLLWSHASIYLRSALDLARPAEYNRTHLFLTGAFLRKLTPSYDFWRTGLWLSPSLLWRPLLKQVGQLTRNEGSDESTGWISSEVAVGVPACDGWRLTREASSGVSPVGQQLSIGVRLSAI